MKKPIYQEIETYIEEQISNGSYQRGSMIPSEDALCKQFHTTRMTVRRAIRDLVFKGMLHSMKGKGTFVTTFDNRTTMNLVCGWKKTIEAEGASTHADVLNAYVQKADPASKKALQLQDDEAVFVLEKVRYMNQYPVLIEKTYLRKASFPKIENYDFDQMSLYDVLTRDYRCQHDHVYQKINLAKVTGTYAHVLFQEEEGVALLMKNTSYNKAMQPIEYSECYINGDKFPLRYVISC